MDMRIQPGDITRAQVDAVVNAANSSLMGGGGVDGAIHRRGGPSILEACRELRNSSLPDGLPTGRAVATTAGELPATWVIHTVGPVYSISEDRTELLVSCYRESLRAAVDVGATTVAFPAISAGIYGWPLEDATRVAVETVQEMIDEVGERITEVLFVPFDEAAENAYRRHIAGC
ncbi:O-acetyl-ADP-ribose deacetylase [Kocuria coralli]|uniref:O-acetyl-ADP-ribose deacetylase n=1 Tax=Kocuria coralli TaxID=1461025 RepID=A0A5J5KX16_9MICC|nr:O-acetyl-ADP-ribose deacetylase [Kocuria coralli]KAA9393366.1 O-acetyl-ADP-ribose deacetylase [Kocuria coralli]